MSMPMGLVGYFNLFSDRDELKEYLQKNYNLTIIYPAKQTTLSRNSCIDLTVS